MLGIWSSFAEGKSSAKFSGESSAERQYAAKTFGGTISEIRSCSGVVIFPFAVRLTNSGCYLVPAM